MLDKTSVKSFWDGRAATYRNVAFESIANLEENPEFLKLKIQLETKKVNEYLGSVAGKTILDLGAGVGQWSFRFVEAGAAGVTAVEYSEPLAELGRNEAAKRGVTNLSFEVSEAERFRSEKTYDIVFISGLFVYMNDEQAESLTRNLRDFGHKGTVFLLRDGTAISGRHEINNRMSEHLRSLYSAVYRTRQEYVDLFAKNGLTLLRDENMFDEDCPLNKYPETRLRIYLFQRQR